MWRKAVSSLMISLLLFQLVSFNYTHSMWRINATSEGEAADELPWHGGENVSRRLPHRSAGFMEREIGTNRGILPTTKGFKVSQNISECLVRYNVSQLRHLAWSLNHDPSLIYYYVRNNIDYEPYFGPMAGPEWTLLQRSGNSFDQATLLVALLRESEVPARYVYGTVELSAEVSSKWLRVKNSTLAANLLAKSGVPITKIFDPYGNVTRLRLEHVWTEAYLPYQDFRGQQRSQTRCVWIPLDPSYKIYKRTSAIESPFDSAWIDDFSSKTLSSSAYSQTQGWVTDINHTFVIREALSYRDEVFQSMLSDPELSNISFNGLSGSWELIKEDSRFLPSVLPYEIVSVQGVYSEIPRDYQHKITFRIDSNDLYTASSSEIAGKRVTLTFAPATDSDAQMLENSSGMLDVTAYLVEMKPVLLIQGELVAVGSPVMLGGTLAFTTLFCNTYLGWNESTDNDFTVGAYYALTLNMGKVSSQLLRQHTTALNMTMFSQANETIQVPFDDLVGELLYVHGLTYFYEKDFLSPQPAGVRWHRTTPALAITSMDVIVWTDHFDRPIDLDAGGMTIDVVRNIIAVVGEEERDVTTYMLASGIFGSSLEHEIFEFTYNVEAVSTIKVLEEANARGIPIYTIDQTNLHDVLAVLQLESSVENWIESDIMAGCTVIVPERELQIQNWRGVGWAVIDLETGAYGYYISGGVSGKVSGGTIASILPLVGFFLDVLPFVTAGLQVFGRISGLTALVSAPFFLILSTIVLAVEAYMIASELERGAVTQEEFDSLKNLLLVRLALKIILALLGAGGILFPPLIFPAILVFVISVLVNRMYHDQHTQFLENAGAQELGLKEWEGLFIESPAHKESWAVCRKAMCQRLHRHVPPIDCSGVSIESMRQGVEWLQNSRSTDGFWGWKSEIRHAAWALITLSEQGHVFHNTTDWLLNQQQSDGSWGSFESTCYAVWALSQAEIVDHKAIDLILDSQNDDGGWNDHISTSLATISLVNSGVTVSNETVAWLLKAQNPDGGWGTWNSETFDTSLVLKALALLGVHDIKGLEWLKLRQSARGGWTYVDSTALALDCLAQTDFNCTSAVDWLLDEMKCDGGWGLDRSDSFTTAVVVHVLSQLNSPFSASGIQWLLTNQNPDGGWGFSAAVSSGFLRDTVMAGQLVVSEKTTTWIQDQQQSDASWGNVDSTARAITYLGNRGIDTTRAVSWLVANQNPDGGWGLYPSYRSSPWETALAVNALATEPGYDIQRNTAINWLLAHQNPDGGWGINTSDLYITCVSVLSLTSVNHNLKATNLHRALAWLENQTWTSTSETSIMIMAFIKASYESDLIGRGVQWLVANQNPDGGWGASKNRTSTPYHTSMAIRALNLSAVDTTPPTIQVLYQVPLEPSSKQEVEVTANVTDDMSGVQEVILSYSNDTTWKNITFIRIGGGTYTANITAMPGQTYVKYKVIAYDDADNAAVDDNSGLLYTYTVISEPALVFISRLLSWIAAISLGSASCITGYLYFKTRRRLRDIRQKMRGLRKTELVCAHCKTINAPRAKFCRKCGKPLQ